MQTETHETLDLVDDQRVSADESLTGVLRDLAVAGFDGSFRPAPDPVEGQAAVVCASCRTTLPARDLAVAEERRLEGASDPDDMVLVVAAACPACSARGVIVLAYGPEASPEDSDLVVALDSPDPTPARPPRSAEGGGEGDEDGGSTADPGGDSDPDSNEGFEAPARDDGPAGLGRIPAAIDGIAALDRVADPIRRTIRTRVPGPALDALRGRWLGHALHPLLTDLPIGFWTSAWVLDVAGGERTDDVADAFVAAGLVAAVPTAWSGWADWTELPRGKRRSGLVHAISIGATSALYGASLVARRRGDRTTGVRLGHAAAAIATVGGFLGGHLAFGDD